MKIPETRSPYSIAFDNWADERRLAAKRHKGAGPCPVTPKEAQLWQVLQAELAKLPPMVLDEVKDTPSKHKLFQLNTPGQKSKVPREVLLAEEEED